MLCADTLHRRAATRTPSGYSEMTSVSVVIPVRNDADLLERCLLALERQTRRPDEVVVVDNGSRDGSAAVAARHGARVVPAPTPGLPGATATGFDHARGTVLARIDADSLPPAGWLQRVVAGFEADPTLAAITGSGRFYGGPPLLALLGRTVWLGGYFHVVGPLLGHPPLYGSGFAMRAELWRRVRTRVHRDLTDVHDDLDLSLQLPPGVRVRYDPHLRVGVSARSLLRRGGVRNGIVWAARTLLVTHREEPLYRRRLAWFLSSIGPRPHSRGVLRLLEEGEHVAAQLVWGRLARTVTSGIDPEVGPDLGGVPPLHLDGPEIALADRVEDGDAGAPQ